MVLKENGSKFLDECVTLKPYSWFPLDTREELLKESGDCMSMNLEEDYHMFEYMNQCGAPKLDTIHEAQWNKDAKQPPKPSVLQKGLRRASYSMGDLPALQLSTSIFQSIQDSASPLSMEPFQLESIPETQTLNDLSNDHDDDYFLFNRPSHIQNLGDLNLDGMGHQDYEVKNGNPSAIKQKLVSSPEDVEWNHFGNTAYANKCDWMKQEAEFGGTIRRTKSAAELGHKFNGTTYLQSHCEDLNDKLHLNYSNSNEMVHKVGKLTNEERTQKILRYRQKRHERNFNKQIKYMCRKTLADNRPRVRGRFAKNVKSPDFLSSEPKIIEDSKSLHGV